MRLPAAALVRPVVVPLCNGAYSLAHARLTHTHTHTVARARLRGIRTTPTKGALLALPQAAATPLQGAQRSAMLAHPAIMSIPPTGASFPTLRSPVNATA